MSVWHPRLGRACYVGATSMQAALVFVRKRATVRPELLRRGRGSCGCASQAVIKRLNEEMQFYKLELHNRENNYNKAITSWSQW